MLPPLQVSISFYIYVYKNSGRFLHGWDIPNRPHRIQSWETTMVATHDIKWSTDTMEVIAYYGLLSSKYNYNMATPMKELGYGPVEVYSEETLGVGSYGKVCRAKCGQLPCAAKLLHDTMGISKFVEQFEQECSFLRMIKHPNIVQFLGTVRDPRSQRLALLMELMDESLTRFLERSTGPLPYHTQLNICHDVALALDYLHSNNIIHRDLSSNNVLLIGEGSRQR